MRILIVGADDRTSRSIKGRLTRDGFSLDALARPDRLRNADWFRACDLLIVNDRPPALDGRALCREVRAIEHRLPIIMTSIRVRVQDRVLGLDAGADDYLTRPFSVRELAARVRALLRRCGDAGIRRLEVANLWLDPITRQVQRGERRIELTSKEFGVLECLMRHEGRPVSRETIAQRAWNKRWDGLTNEIDVFVSRLRKKIEHPGQRRLFHAVRGFGYAIGSAAE